MAPFLGAVPYGMDGVGIALVIGLLVVCLGIHEAAHAWVAYKCGDSTAKDLGRITVNPIVHIDPVLTIIVPLMLYLSPTGFLFGGAKPVPVNYHRLRSPLRDMMLVALAGPVSNFLLAALFALALRVVGEFGLYEPDQMMGVILRQAVLLNLSLAAFNMLPIPPLDGSRVMAWILPESLRPGFVAIERFGLLLVLGAILLPGVRDVTTNIIMSSINAMAEFIYWFLDPVLALLHTLVGIVA